MGRTPPTPLFAAALAACLAGTALGQGTMKFQAPGGERSAGGGGGAVHIDDPDDPRVQAYAAQQKVRLAVERELRKIRMDYFRARRTDIRQAGILKLRQYKDPAIFPSLLEIFKGEGTDVRLAILDHLAEQRSSEADTTLAWAAVFDKSPEFRAAAGQRLMTRLHEVGSVSPAVKTVLAEALRRDDTDQIVSAAKVIHDLKLIEAIPMLIAAQIGGQQQTVNTGGGGDDGHSLAWIMVATQEAFVADLTPVVGDSAVAFDPTIGVVTEGVVLRVIDAVVITYRVEVHNYLVGLSTEAWGQRTDYLGWDNQAWNQWYARDFKPFLAEQAAQRELAGSQPQALKPAAPAPAVPPGH